MSNLRRKRLESGAEAPGFSLPLLGGPTMDLRSLAGEKPVLLAFYKVSCPTCQYTLPFLERLHQRQSGAPVYAISQSGADDAREFNRYFGITMPTLLDAEDAGYQASNAYGITLVPSLFLVEPGGRIGFASDGFSKPDLEALGKRLGVEIFEPGEDVPAWKAG
jgi:peroxiredoxin